VGVVDGVEHEVLVVPAESGVLLAHVDPGNIDSGHRGAFVEIYQGIFMAVVVVHVPGVLKVLLAPRVYEFLLFPSEAGAEFVGGQVCGVLNDFILPLVEFHFLPVFFFQPPVALRSQIVVFLLQLGFPVELREGVAFWILVEGLGEIKRKTYLALAQLKKVLVTRRYFLV